MRNIPRQMIGIGVLLLATGCGDNGYYFDGHHDASAELRLTGNTTTMAGDGTAADRDSLDGTGATARFYFPRGLTTDGTFLYLAESSGRRVRRIDPTTGETVTLAGNGIHAYQDSTDGTGATASFMQPRQITYLRNYLYLTDWEGNSIRRVDVKTGETITLAGDRTAAYRDSTDGTGATARFNTPCGITNDGLFLYVVDLNDYHIRRIDPATGRTGTVAGNGINEDRESTDGTGATAGFAQPLQIAAVGNFLYVGTSSRIHKVHKTTGESVFFAGGDAAGFQDSTDGTGATARFDVIMGICSDGVSLFVGDSINNRVRRVSLGSETTATVDRMRRIGFGGGNTVGVIVDHLSLERPGGGKTETLAGDGTAAFQDSTDGTGATAQLYNPRACVPLNGSLYVADGNNMRVRRIQ